MATIDRIDSGYRAWSPSAAGYADTHPTSDEAADEYIGRHRRSGMRRLGVLSMFYTAKHRRV